MALNSLFGSLYTDISMGDAAWVWLALPSTVIWLGVLIVPWLPWLNREYLEPDLATTVSKDDIDLSEVTVLVPARNEAGTIATTVEALHTQGVGLRILVIDDQSEDRTADLARTAGATVLQGAPLPQGWTGKLWALEQGLAHVQTPLTLLLDGDIVLKPNLLAALLRRKRERGAQLVSLMADLRRISFWDRLLLPAFVYYFKLLYPFAISNSGSRWVAAAAGGCILVETEVLRTVGAFSSMRDALIDDCTLARQIKEAGGRIWIGLSRGVVSYRIYTSFNAIYQMIARSAYTQLRYSLWLLSVVTIVFIVAYWLPLVVLLIGTGISRMVAFTTLIAMLISYIPTLYYYRVSPYFALLLPVTGTLYLAMTWGSALGYWHGVRSSWKGRNYTR